MAIFVSYAQNFEDVILHRVFQEIELGFYIDVGANDPDVDSVTKALYDRGWRGINIEPIPEWYERLQTSRPRDINLPIAAGSESGELILYDLPGTGLASVDLAIAKRHEKERGYKKREIRVPVEPLNTICEKHHLAPIHFLKVDVEGAEKAVLEGLDLERIRPWVLIVESTLPNSPQEDFDGWEPLILGSNYDFVYFDGLNRYYLAEEHHSLRDRFRKPPNVFDNFVPYRQILAEDRAKELTARLDAETQRAKGLHQALVETDVKLHQAHLELDVVRGSWSWKLTIPVRWIGFQCRLLRQYGWRTRLQHLGERFCHAKLECLGRGGRLEEGPKGGFDLPPLASRLRGQLSVKREQIRRSG